jgi:hypothetical protein
MAERPIEGTEDDKCTQEVENIGSNSFYGAKEPLKICVQLFVCRIVTPGKCKHIESIFVKYVYNPCK